MTMDDYKKDIQNCPRCGSNHTVFFHAYKKPKNGVINKDQFTHYGECLRTHQTVQVRINSLDRVEKIG